MVRNGEGEMGRRGEMETEGLREGEMGDLVTERRREKGTDLQ